MGQRLELRGKVLSFQVSTGPSCHTHGSLLSDILFIFRNFANFVSSVGVFFVIGTQESQVNVYQASILFGYLLGS